MPYTPIDQTRVLWDAAGRPYWASVDGKTRHYIPPITASQYRDDPRMLQWAASQGVTPENPSGTIQPGGFFKGRGEWQSDEGQYEQPTNWGNIAALGVGGAIAAPFVAPVLGFGAGQAAGAAGASGLTEGLMSAVPASIASQGISSTVPLGGMMVGGAGGAGAAGAASGIGSRLADTGKDFLSDLASPQGAASLAALIAGLRGQGSGQESSEEMRRIQAITEAQMRRADPLHQVAVNLAFGRMPTNYRQGVNLQNIPLPGASNG